MLPESLPKVRVTVTGFLIPENVEFSIGAPIMDLTAAPYGGARYPVEATMAGRTFSRFHVDVGLGDVIIRPAETIECRDWLAFAGIDKPNVRALTGEQQFAEKLHAYTLPRSNINTRVKDLVDMVLLFESGKLNALATTEAFKLTFERRSTHEIPLSLLAHRPTGKCQSTRWPASVESRRPWQKRSWRLGSSLKRFKRSSASRLARRCSDRN